MYSREKNDGKIFQLTTNIFIISSNIALVYLWIFIFEAIVSCVSNNSIVLYQLMSKSSKSNLFAYTNNVLCVCMSYRMSHNPVNIKYQ